MDTDGPKEALAGAADSTWLERMARWGLAVRGILYLFVAFLAVRLAQGHDGGRADKQGALQAVVRQPLGKVVLIGLAGGFAGYALWRFIEAAVGPPNEDDPRKAIVKRVGYAARGLLYSALFVSALRLIRSSKDTSGSDRAEADLTARVLNWPAGPWLVGVAGMAVIGAGLYVGWRGVSTDFRKHLKSIEMGRSERRWVVRLGVVGMVSRMLVALIIGGVLLAAAFAHDATDVVGVDGALKRLAGRPFGPVLLAAAAAGLACYGLYSLAEARYRRVGSS
ncbi:MAG: DUF1206 domain-containing protein [Acidimicrobiales bacterium]